MMRFNNLSRKESLDIYSKLIDNSKVLLSSGSLLSEQKNYGVATSLTILGGEELIKGAVLYFHGMGINILKVDEFKGIFMHHIPKHDAAKISELLKIFEAIIKLEEKKIKPKSTENWLDKTIHFLNLTISFLLPIVDMTHNLEWWAKADKLKNRGLYVDYLDELLTPSQIKLEDFNNAAKIMKELSNRFRVIRIFVKKLEAEELKMIVKKINEHL